MPKHCLASTSKATILNMAIPIIPTPRYVPAPDHYFLLNSKSTDIDLVMALQHWQFPSAAYPKHGFIPQDIKKHGQLRFNYSLKKKNHQGVIEVLLLRQAFVVHNDDFKDESFFCFWDSNEFPLGYVDRAVPVGKNSTVKGYNHATASLAWDDAKIKAGWEQDWFNATDEPSNGEVQSCHDKADESSSASWHDLGQEDDQAVVVHDQDAMGDQVAKDDQVAVAHPAGPSWICNGFSVDPSVVGHCGVQSGWKLVGPIAGHEQVDQHPDEVAVPHAEGELVGDHAANSSSMQESEDAGGDVEELLPPGDVAWLHETGLLQPTHEVPGLLHPEVLSGEWQYIGSSHI